MIFSVLIGHDGQAFEYVGQPDFGIVTVARGISEQGVENLKGKIKLDGGVCAAPKINYASHPSGAILQT